MTVHPMSPAGDVLAVPEHLDAAAAAGRRLATLGGRPSGIGRGDPVEAMARAGLPRLRQMGIDAEVVRSRRDCLVVRSAARSPTAAMSACTLVGTWLESLPTIAYGTPGTVAESTCAARGGPVCIHTLMWRRGAQAPLPGAPAAVRSRIDLVGPPVPPAPRPVLAGASAGAPPVLPRVAPPPTLVGGPNPEGTLQAGGEGRPPALLPGGPRSSRRLAWARRRAWLLVVGLLAGTVGGALAAAHGTTDYSATTELVVQAAASTTAATGSANGAEELAVTYAALIPDDQALLARIGKRTGTSPAGVAHRLSVQAEAGTAIIMVRFTGPDAASAVAGANEVAEALTSTTPPGHAIVAGSVSVVSAARSASRSGSLRTYGLPLGMVLGLIVGAGAALAAERSDRRVDDVDDVGDAAGCSATVAPGGITPSELARTLEHADRGPVAVVPLRAAQTGPAGHLARSLREVWRRYGAPGTGAAPQVSVSTPFVTSPTSLSDGTGPTVLVVGSGERAAVVSEVAERLRLLGRDPAWAVLVRAGGAGSSGDHGR